MLNAGDPDVPSVGRIAGAVDTVMGTRTETVLLPGAPPEGVGDTPWSIPHPLVLDMSAADVELGYRPVTSYAESLPETVDWLLSCLNEGPWERVFPDLARAYGSGRGGMFDYAAEDAWFHAHGEGEARS